MGPVTCKKWGKTGIFFFLLAVMSIYLIGLGEQGLLERFAYPQPDPETRLSSHSWLIFVMDFTILMCPPCLDSFLNFYHELAGWTGEGRIWIILVLDKLEKDNPERKLLVRIAEKKLRGFAVANKIRCPILIDPAAAFEDLSQGSTAIILFDRPRNCVKKYNFPLKPSQKKEIIESLIG